MQKSSLSHREEYQKRKRTTRLMQLSAGVVFVILLIGLCSYIAHRQAVRIRHVELSGGILVSEDEVENETLDFLSGSYLFLFPKNNIFYYPHSALENDLRTNFGRIDTISIKQKNFHTLSIAITERKPVALWCNEVNPSTHTSTDNCYFMDDQSVIFAEAPVFSGDAYFKYYGVQESSFPTLPSQSDTTSATSTETASALIANTTHPIGSRYIASTTAFQSIGKFVDLTRTLGLHPQYLFEPSPGQFTLVIGGGGKVYFNTDETFSKIGSNLQALISRIPVLTPSVSHDVPVEYIDLRYGNKLFYKLLGGTASTSTE